MDWVPNSDPFINPKLVDNFECQDTNPYSPLLSQRGSPQCQALHRHDAIAKLKHTTLSDDTKWNTWISSAVLTSGVTLRNGYCILFIPRAAGVQLQTGEDTSGFTELPITLARWKTVAEAFYLPGHFYKVASRRLLSVISVQRTCDISKRSEKVWMQTAATNPEDGRRYGFALAATHIESRRFTYAVMVGCTHDQIRKVKKLVEGWEEGAKHPLMMLGVCAELHLQRVEALVSKRSDEYKKLKNKLDESRGTNQFNWNMIDSVRLEREESIRAATEINTTISQLSKAYQSGIKTLRDQYQDNASSQTSSSSSVASQTSPSSSVASRTSPSPAVASQTTLSPAVGGQTSPSPAVTSQTSPSPAVTSQTSPSPTVGSQTSPSPAGQATSNKDEAIEVTNLFEERFQDILSRLEGLGAECQIGVEGISFSTDVIRSELARQDTAYGTAFALMAAVYLPTTAVATILAMPIFGWTNDWRDWSYHPMTKSSGDGGSGDSGAGDPVVSGYVWVWVAASVGCSIITFIVFYVCVYRKLHRRNRNN